MVRGRPEKWEPKIKPITPAQQQEASKPSNAVSPDLKPVKRGGVTKWVKK